MSCFYIIIEATSALDLQAEKTMYTLLQEADVTYVSVGHRPSLLHYHTQKLILNPSASISSDNKSTSSGPLRVPIVQQNPVESNILTEYMNFMS